MISTVLGTDGLRRPAWAATDPLMREYYDTEWGLPIRSEKALFERISLEAFQSGLSWAIILKKREAFRAVFANFDPEVVANFAEREVELLMANPGIVRNRRKIIATIANARATIALRDTGGLVDFIWSFQPDSTPAPNDGDDDISQSVESIALSQALRKKGFSFVGPTTMYALMEAIGMVDAHPVTSHRRGSSGVWSASGSAR